MWEEAGFVHHAAWFLHDKQRLHSLSLLIRTCPCCSLAAFPQPCAVCYCLWKTGAQACLWAVNGRWPSPHLSITPLIWHCIPWSPMSVSSRLSPPLYMPPPCSAGPVWVRVKHDTNPYRPHNHDSAHPPPSVTQLFALFKAFPFRQLHYLLLLHLRNSPRGQICPKNNGNRHGCFNFPNSLERKWKLILQMLSTRVTLSWKGYVHQAEQSLWWVRETKKRKLLAISCLYFLSADPILLSLEHARLCTSMAP